MESKGMRAPGTTKAKPKAIAKAIGIFNHHQRADSFGASQFLEISMTVLDFLETHNQALKLQQDKFKEDFEKIKLCKRIK